jgi:thioredoxin reductase (NADPH)
MLTLDEVRTIPLFASLDEQELERIARTSEDIYLSVGEFAVAEGGERAFFAVLSGKVEVVKAVDGVERVLGFRLPGTIFGEVPLALGTTFPGGYRAAEASRVIRLEPRSYYAVAAASPEFAARVAALARERIGGLQGLAAEAPKPRVTIVGQRWDNVCADMRRFLDRNQIVFDWVPIDSPDLSSRWSGAIPKADDLPALRFDNGSIVIQPSLRALAQHLGLQTIASSRKYDTVIIGGGPAGLAAAVYGASEGLHTLVIEREAPGGQAGTSSRIENYLGFPNGVSGDELASRALHQAKRLGAEILVTRTVERIDTAAREIVLDGGDVVAARTVILATGVTWRHLAIEGFERLVGKGIYYGAARHEAGTTSGLDIHLVGGGNSAGQAAVFFSHHARSVTLVVRSPLERTMSQYLIDQLRTKANIHVQAQSEVKAVYGDGILAAIDIAHSESGEVRRHECGGLFIFIGADADTGWLPDTIARDPRGYVLTGADVLKSGLWQLERNPFLLETSAPGVFACGDVRRSMVKRVASAVGEGSMAVAFVHQFLQHAGD